MASTDTHAKKAALTNALRPQEIEIGTTSQDPAVGTTGVTARIIDAVVESKIIVKTSTYGILGPVENHQTAISNVYAASTELR